MSEKDKEQKRTSMQVIEDEFGSNEDTKLSKRKSDSGWGMEPANMSEAMKLCKFIADSQIVPKQYQGKPQDIFVAIQHGQEIGLKPLQSLNSVAVINGKPTVDNITFLALARQHSEFEWIKEDNQGFAYARDNVAGWEHLKDVDPNSTSICVVKRAGEDPIVGEFSAEDVKRAGLGNVHKTYPKDMRKYRARQRALEPAFGEVLKGFKMTEIEEENVEVYGEYYEGKEDDQAKTKKAQVSNSIKESMKAKSKQASNSAAKSSKKQEASKDTNDEVEDAVVVEDEPEDTDEQAEPVEGMSPLTPDDREQLMAAITKEAKKTAKDMQEKWFNLIKQEQALVDENAETMMDLSSEDLLELAGRFGIHK